MDQPVMRLHHSFKKGSLDSSVHWRAASCNSEDFPFRTIKSLNVYVCVLMFTEELSAWCCEDFWYELLKIHQYRA